MKFGSVCSGIEAASVAWHELGWRPTWLSEIDVAAANVLSHRVGATAPRFPASGTEKSLAKFQWADRVTNWGDMTKLPELVRTGEAEAPDVFCGGTPCQAFSLAGRRAGLNDNRGNLTLTFVEIANEIDLKRTGNGEEPCVIFWENVPGVLSDKTNAFGYLLAGLAGEDVPLEPPGKRWADSGVVIGPERTVAWRSLDAQYFGLAQRRERVFVVASAREGFDPVEVLLEFDGLRRDSAPSREAWEEVAGTLDARPTGGGFPGTDGACCGHVVPEERSGRPAGLGPQWWDGSPVSQTLDAVLHKGQTMPEKNRFPAVLQPIPFDTTQITSPQNGCNPKPGAPCHPLAAGAHAPAIAFHPTQDPISSDGVSHALGCVTGERTFWPAEISSPLNANYGHKQGLDNQHVNQGCPLFVPSRAPTSIADSPPIAIAFHLTQDPISSEGVTHALGCGSTRGQASVAVAFSCKDYAADASEELSPTMRAMGHKDSHANAGGQLAVCVTGERTHALNTANNGKGSSEDGTGRGVPTIATTSGMAVRRLMPTECERLQGFFDWWTAVPTTPVTAANQGKAREAMEAGDTSFCEVDGAIFNVAADGPRYKQLGNSWAVPVVAWIGARIDRHIRNLDARTVAPEAKRWSATIAWLTSA